KSDAIERGLGKERPTERLQVYAARQVIACHVSDRPAPEQPHPVELASSQQHLRKTVIVPGGADQAAAAGKTGRRAERLPAHRVAISSVSKMNSACSLTASVAPTQKGVSVMTRASKMRSAKKRSSDWPDATSITRPSTSVATE